MKVILSLSDSICCKLKTTQFWFNMRYMLQKSRRGNTTTEQMGIITELLHGASSQPRASYNSYKREFTHTISQYSLIFRIDFENKKFNFWLFIWYRWWTAPAWPGYDALWWVISCTVENIQAWNCETSWTLSLK